MTRTTSYAIVAALVAYVVATKVVTFVILGQTTGLGQLPSEDVVQQVGWAVVHVTYLALGSLLIVRRPDNRISWLIAILVAISATGVVADAVQDHGSGWVASWAASLATWYEEWWFAAVLLSFLLLFHWFPTGRPVSGRWGYFTYVTYVSAALVFQQALPGDALDGGALALLLGAASIVSLASCVPIVIVRFRRSTDRTRQQIKWFLFSTVSALVLWVNQGSLSALAYTALLLPAIGIGVALLRYRLYDIDRIISRTTSYAIVTALLVSTYAIIVTSVTRFLPDASSLAVAAATLAAAAVARPLLQRVQGAVDRRFNRAAFDADRAVHDFGSSLRTIVDPDVVRAELSAVLIRTVQPDGVRIWLRRPA